MGGGGFDQGDDINEPLTCAEKERDNYNSDNWSQSLTVLKKSRKVNRCMIRL